MVLIHGTSTANSVSIQDAGVIRPRVGKGNWFRETHQPSIDGFVYFAGDRLRAEFHATRTALLTNSDCSLLSVDVDSDNLYPDENLYNDKGIINTNDLAEMQSRALENKNDWVNSLCLIDLVAHKGSVSTDRIVKEVVFPIQISEYYGFIKHFDNPTVDTFDFAFNMFLNTNHLWNDSLKDKIKNFELYPNNTIRYKDKLYLLDINKDMVV